MLGNRATGILCLAALQHNSPLADIEGSIEVRAAFEIFRVTDMVQISCAYLACIRPRRIPTYKSDRGRNINAALNEVV